jgi:cell division protein FtsL
MQSTATAYNYRLQNKKKLAISKTRKTEKAASSNLAVTICAIIALFGFIAFCNLYLNVVSIENSLKIETLKTEMENQRNAKADLESTLSDLKNPLRIEQLAKKIGMEQAKHAGFISLNTVKAKKIAEKPRKSVKSDYQTASILSYLGNVWSPSR